MIAILVHFLGHLLVDSAIPPWVGSADAYFLAWWFAGFAAVDLIALALASGWLRLILAIGFAWSAALSIEQAMLGDLLHQADQPMQIIIDVTLFVYFVVLIVKARRNREIKA